MKVIVLALIALVATCSTAWAEIFDSSNKEYFLSGTTTAKAVGICYGFYSAVENTEKPNTLKVTFSNAVEGGAHFQIIGDDVFSPDQPLDMTILEKKRNKIIADYVGINPLVAYAQNTEQAKNLELNLKVKSHSFKTFVREDMLKLKEKLVLTSPYVYNGRNCDIKITVKRYLEGPLLTPPVL